MKHKLIFQFYNFGPTSTTGASGIEGIFHDIGCLIIVKSRELVFLPRKTDDDKAIIRLLNDKYNRKINNSATGQVNVDKITFLR